MPRCLSMISLYFLYRLRFSHFVYSTTYALTLSSGHKYLENKCYLQISFDHQSSGVKPITLFGSRDLSSLQLTISSIPETFPYSIILPFEQNETEIFSFVEDEDLALRFDIFPTFGTKVIGRAHVLPKTLGLNKGGGYSKCSIPLFDTQLKVVGQVNFDAFVVKPFIHHCLGVSGKLPVYWKSTAAASEVVPSSNMSVVTDSSLAKEYVQVSVVVTADGIPVVTPSFWIKLEDGVIAACNLTLKQMRMLGGGERRDFNVVGDAHEFSAMVNSSEFVVELEEVLDVCLYPIIE
jgi:CDK inhibitor PHO81